MIGVQSLLKVASVLVESRANYALPVKKAMKIAVDVQWVPPEKKPFYHPSISGDLEPLEIPSPDELHFDFADSEELKSANDEVKKIFSLKTHPTSQILRVYRNQLMNRVKSHKYDTSSKEVWIARYTASIRYYQYRIELEGPRYFVPRLKYLIDQRTSKLKTLRNVDYKKYEWVLEKLNLEHRPGMRDAHKVTRKSSLSLLCQLEAEKEKEKKLALYKKELDDQKIPFLSKKLEKLKWIREMEEKNKLPSTVTLEDIAECEKRIEDVKLTIAQNQKYGYERKIHPFLVEPYNEKLLLEMEKKNCAKAEN